ncbi:MAG: hypothetical protein LUE21_10370 [Oscillospiraceae bacterium]|nr:hypothetical protein [Oscillospiraceae bacterium]
MPICSSTVYGYYLADSDEEKDTCVRSLRRRAREIARTADALAASELEEVGR